MTTAQNALLITALLCTFAGGAVIARRVEPYWVLLVFFGSATLAALIVARSREVLDLVFAVLAVLSTLIGLSWLAGLPGDWTEAVKIVSAFVVAGTFVLLTRNRREILIAIAAVIAFRTLLFGGLAQFRREAVN